ncbi:MAG: TonB-dependent receptor, partial [Flavobacteriaceae bacterium]
IQTDLSFEYNNEHLELYANGFYNTIQDYIFIEPNGEFVGADAVFLYNQQDANLYGAEIGVHLHPHPLDWLHLESSFETVTGKTKSGDFLPLIPANRWTNTLRVEFSKPQKTLQNSYSFVTLQSFFNQNKTSFFETATAGYNLLNMGLGGRLLLGKQPLEFRVSANNLLDKTYISHLSRLKIDGIPNIGRNISLGLSIPI